MRSAPVGTSEELVALALTQRAAIGAPRDDSALDRRAVSTIRRLISERDEAREALRPFAAIKPSSFYAPDGSNGEAYRVHLSDDLDPSADFTGLDLARARAALSPKREGE